MLYLTPWEIKPSPLRPETATATRRVGYAGADLDVCEDAFAMRPASIFGATGSLLVSLTTVLYLAVINSQGNVDKRRVTVWVVTLATCALLGTVASWSRQPRVRSIILATTAGALLGLGFLGIFSIGLLLVAAGVLLMVATLKAAAEDRSGSMVLPCLLGGVAFAGAPTLLLWII